MSTRHQKTFHALDENYAIPIEYSKSTSASSKQITEAQNRQHYQPEPFAAMNQPYRWVGKSLYGNQIGVQQTSGHTMPV